MLPAEVTDSLKNIAQSNKISNYEIVVDNGSSSSTDGFLSVIKRVTIKDPDSKKELNLVVKLALSVEGDDFSSKQFQREIFFYKNILPAFTALANDFSAPDLLSTYIKCYETGLGGGGKAFLIFENIKLLGYKLFPALQPLSQQHVRLVCKAFGKFHALSLALNNKKPALFSEFVNEVRLPPMQLSKDALQKSIFQTMYVNAKRVFGEGSVKLEAYKRIWQHGKYNIFELNQHAPVDEFTVILHGDSWLNNILFKHEDDKPTGLKLLDFQIMIAGPSTCDLSAFLFICCDKDLLVDLNKYLDIYYDTVSKTLQRLDCDPSKVFPRKVFDEQWREYSPFGLIAATLFIKMLLLNKEEKVLMQQSIVDPESFFLHNDIERQAVYHKRMQDLLDIMMEHKLL